MKKTYTVNLDTDVVEKAKGMRVNLSGTINELLKKNLIPKLSDLPKEAVILKCTQCLKEIKYGFYCSDRSLFLCQECQDNFNMSKCKHDARGEHFHIRVPGFEGQNMEYLKYGQKRVEENTSNVKTNTE